MKRIRGSGYVCKQKMYVHQTFVSLGLHFVTELTVSGLF